MPARRPTRDSRELIFKAAAAEFAERGYEAAGVDRIAAHARVNKAMIYYHFGSKADLYREVLQDMFRAVSARARAIADGDGTPEAKFDIWVATLVEEAAARPHFPPIMLRELASGGEHLDSDTVRLLDAVYGAVRDMVLAGQKGGDFANVNPLLAHFTIIPAVMFFLARARVISRPGRSKADIADPITREAFVRHMQRVVRRMLRKD
jgi:TetR/AcrR family transcriptional regulator